MSSYKISPEIETTTVKTLIERIEKGYQLQSIKGRDLSEDEILNFNSAIILQPDYQREYRFTVEEEARLIESVLIGIPIPPIFLATDKYNSVRVVNVVDGQHRLRALYRFQKNEFKLKNLTLLEEYDNLKFEDLDIDIKSDFNEATIQIIEFKEFPGIEFELEIFNRYNKGTNPLSDQEIRHAVYNSEHNKFINDFTYKLHVENKDDNLRLAYNITRDRIQKKKVQEGLFVILNILENGIDSTYNKSLDYAEMYMKEKADLQQSDKVQYKEDLEDTEQRFDEFNNFILRLQEKVKYPFSKEIYGVSSRNYKFQISTAMILSGIFNKIYGTTILKDIMENEDKRDLFLDVLKENLLNSFLEDPNYKASSTNSKELSVLINKIEEILLMYH